MGVFASNPTGNVLCLRAGSVIQAIWQSPIWQSSIFLLLVASAASPSAAARVSVALTWIFGSQRYAFPLYKDHADQAEYCAGNRE